MSKSFFLLLAAISVSAAPDLNAQSGPPAKARVPDATIARMVAVKKPQTKASTLRGPTAAQRASQLVAVTLPNGERRMVRPKKPTK